MSCERTQHLIADYCDGGLSEADRRVIDRHLEHCGACAAELQAVGPDLFRTIESLQRWRDEKPLAWDRTMGIRFRPKREPFGGGGWARWFPLATAMVLVVMVMLNVQVQSSDAGFTIAFGSMEQPARDSAELSEAVSRRLAEFEQDLLARVDERQNDANVTIARTVLEQSQESTLETLEQVVAYFEERRQADLQTVLSSYEELVDSDYRTIRSVQELANMVQYQNAQYQNVQFQR